MIEFAKVEQAIMAKALVGLERTAEFTLAKAKEHAPVRAIFQGRMRGRAYSATAESSKGLRNKMYGEAPNPKFEPDRGGWSKSQYQRWKSSLQPSRRVYTGRAMESLLGDDEGAIPMERRELMRGVADLGEAANPRSERAQRSRRSGEQAGAIITGTPNSFIPVRRLSNNWRISGDFRRFEKGKLARVTAIAQRGDRSVVKMISGTRYLTDAGRREIRKIQRAEKGNALYKGRVGGRLRGEIRMTQPETHGKTTWIYIESPTPYAKYQEFGTSKHRSQPFLRPALYESRQVLRYEVRRAIDKRFAAPGVRSKNWAGLA